MKKSQLLIFATLILYAAILSYYATEEVTNITSSTNPRQYLHYNQPYFLWMLLTALPAIIFCLQIVRKKITSNNNTRIVLLVAGLSVLCFFFGGYIAWLSCPQSNQMFCGMEGFILMVFVSWPVMAWASICALVLWRKDRQIKRINSAGTNL